MEDRIRDLKVRVKAAQDAYYNLSPIMSDQEFDALADELRTLEPEATEVLSVGAPVPSLSVWDKVRHEIPMGSLGKVNSRQDLVNWANGTGANIFHITHKIDGSSMELIYKAGKLKKCVTRGDGVIGEDVTVNVTQIPDVPSDLGISIDAIIRGEIVMMKSVFDQSYAKEYANPRNTAAAKVREKKGGGTACRDLSFLAYGLKTDDQPRTMHYMAIWLKNHGFQIPEGCAGNIESILQVYEATVIKRKTIPYEIDGMVVSVNDLEKLEDLGSLNMRPRGQIAWKFDAEMRETKVQDVVWQVGPTGRICPVAKVEPVNIGGVTITSVSLHNLSLFRSLRLSEGCRVLVSRRNDVIPYIEANLDSQDG